MFWHRDKAELISVAFGERLARKLAKDFGAYDFGPASDCAAAMAWYRAADDKERVGVLTNHAGLPYWRVR